MVAPASVATLVLPSFVQACKCCERYSIADEPALRTVLAASCNAVMSNM